MSFVWFFENSYHFCVYLFSHYMIHLLLLTNDQYCWLIKSIFSNLVRHICWTVWHYIKSHDIIVTPLNLKQTNAFSLITNLSNQNTTADFLNCVDFVAAHAYILAFLNFYHLNENSLGWKIKMVMPRNPSKRNNEIFSACTQWSGKQGLGSYLTRLSLQLRVWFVNPSFFSPQSQHLLNSHLTSYVLLPSPSPGSALVMSQFLSKFVMLFRSFLIWLFSLTNIYYVL